MKLKNVLFCAALVSSTALVTATVVSQDNPGGEMPEWMTPEVMARMSPGENHAKLEQFVGNWTQDMKHWVEPGMEPETMTGSVQYSWVLDGHYLKGEYTGDMGGATFQGLEIMGYDNMRNEYFSIWFDNMGTSYMVNKGQLDGNTMTMTGKTDDPMSGKKDVAMRSVGTIMDKNKMKFEMYMPGEDGKEFKVMEIISTRAK